MPAPGLSGDFPKEVPEEDLRLKKHTGLVGEKRGVPNGTPGRNQRIAARGGSLVVVLGGTGGTWEELAY